MNSFTVNTHTMDLLGEENVWFHKTIDIHKGNLVMGSWVNRNDAPNKIKVIPYPPYKDYVKACLALHNHDALETLKSLILYNDEVWSKDCIHIINQLRNIITP